jgi:phage terminase large subunit-like protein
LTPYNPTKKQEEFHKLGLVATERADCGGNRSGKTWTGVKEDAYHITGLYSSAPWWEGHRFNRPINATLASVTAAETRDNLQYLLLGNPSTGERGIIPQHLILRRTSLSNVPDAVDTAYIQHVSGGVSKLRFKNYRQGREKFQGSKEDLVHFDEEPPYDVYSEALMRLAGVGKDPGIMILTMTPLSGLTPLLMRFFGPDGMPQGVVKDGRTYILVSWDDNPHMPEEEKERLRKNTPPHELEAREKGLPSMGSGLVYPVSESQITVDPFEIPQHWPRVFGMDFGWKAETAVVFIAHDRDSDIAYLYGEYAANQMTPDAHSNNLFRMGASWIPGVCDPAGQATSPTDGQQLINLYLKAGLKLIQANNSKETGIQTVLQRMQTDRLKIFKTLTKTLTELRMYSRDDDGIAKKGNDHLMDAMRYAIVSGLGLARKNPSLSSSDYYSGPVSAWVP